MKTLALNLTELERQIIKAMNGEIIKKIDDKQLLKSLTILIENAFSDTGMNQKSEIKKFAESLMQDVKEYFSSLTIAEIELAIKNGTRNYYGEYFGLNVASIHGFIRAYKHSPDKSEAIRKQRLHEDSIIQPEEQKHENIDLMFKNGCVKAFSEYKLTKKLIDFGSVRFEYLTGKGLLSKSVTEDPELKSRAKTNIELELSDMKRGRDTSSIIQLMNSFNTQRESRLSAEIKLIAMKDYFDSLISQKIELADLLENCESTVNV
jgi:hypothetical protein